MSAIRGILWAVLSETDQQRLLETCGQMHAVAQAHHCTLNYSCDFGDIHHHLGDTITVRTIANCWNDSIQAITVALPELSYFKMEIPHITISKAKGINAGMATLMLKEKHYAVPQMMEFDLSVQFAEFQYPQCPP